MEKDYLNFFVLFCITAFFFGAGIRMKNNPERQIDRLVDMIFNDKTFDKVYLLNKGNKKNRNENKDTELQLIKKEYLKGHDNK